MPKQLSVFINAEAGGFHVARVSEGQEVSSDFSSNALADVLDEAVKKARALTLTAVTVVDHGKKLLRTTSEVTLTVSQLTQYATAEHRKHSR
jgi:hypothetical protein